MDFTFTDEQKMITDSLNKWFLDHYNFQKRCQWISTDCRHQVPIWQGLADLGMLALPFSSKYGGMQASIQDMGVVIASSGSALLLEPLLHYYISSMLLTRIAPSTLQDKIVPQLSRGERICVVALPPACHPNLLSQPQSLIMESSEQGSWRISGYLPMVFGADSATDILAVAQDAQGNKHIVLLPTSAMTVQRFYLIDDTGVANLTLNAVTVPDAYCLPYSDSTLLQAKQAIVSLLGYEAVAIMQVMNEKTRRYLKTREQFGQPLSTFQVLRHRLVEMHVQEELARSLVMAFTIILQSSQSMQDVDTFSYQTKLKMNDYCQYIGEQSVQLHGGMGVSDELDIAHYFRRLTCIRHLFGDQVYAISRGLHVQS